MAARRSNSRVSVLGRFRPSVSSVGIEFQCVHGNAILQNLRLLFSHRHDGRHCRGGGDRVPAVLSADNNSNSVTDANFSNFVTRADHDANAGAGCCKA